ncbi:putative neurogenic locus notch like protein 2 [Amylocarpus encephaloides]|uniref:Neurogenic locus notch like protein 2 n=1 Tax=Amylocarpus encephaloides TaxID=45428 RepID=A0A9P7Y7S8_9HELO|nr:putative neurogenic locus notch like protein 2 [Amylocarpus encephaloides]
MAASGIDIEKPGKYPVVLSDALLGKASKEIYTGVRYNHKEDLSSDSSSTSIHLEPSENDPTSYDISYKENSDNYSYSGTRSSSDGQYVLIFDPAKKHFVLHRVDSTFDMNLVSTPWSQDESTLRSQYTQLNAAKAGKGAKGRPKTTKAAAAAPKVAPRKKVEKVTKPKPPPRAPTPEEEEESDDGLIVDYPDGPPSQNFQYNSTPIVQRHESEDASEEDSDAEGEEYEDERNQDVDHLKLPSPANNGGGMSDEDMDSALEAELEQALEMDLSGGGADESSESEEE